MSVRPTSVEEAEEAVRTLPRVSVRGGGTKDGLAGEGETVETAGLSGITEYEASEYTFTAGAGTPVKEVQEALRAKGQCLPFDPLFAAAGATLGGSVAAGTSGPGRFRYGGLRDFLVGVEFVDGTGRRVRSGGKVVKNAAGFDLSKFLVGSAGRFGLLTEVTFKVFPAPVQTATVEVQCGSAAVAGERMAAIARARWEADALDYDPGRAVIVMRLGAPAEALDSLCAEIAERWSGEVVRLEAEMAEARWSAATEMRWASGETLVKVPLTLTRLARLEEELAGIAGCVRHYSSGGAVAWIGTEGGHRDLETLLAAQGLGGVLIRGAGSGSPWIGKRAAGEIQARIKKALDPHDKFPAL